MLPSWSNEAIELVTELSRSIISVDVCNTATHHTHSNTNLKTILNKPTSIVCFKTKLIRLFVRHVFLTHLTIAVSCSSVFDCNIV